MLIDLDRPRELIQKRNKIKLMRDESDLIIEL